MTEQNKQPPAEAGEGAVAYILRNEYDEYRLEPVDGMDIKQFPVEQEILLYTSQTTATKAAVAAMLLRAAEVCDEVTSFKMAEWSSPQARPLMPDEIKERILALIPADDMQAVRELMIESAKAGAEYGAYPNDDETFLKTLDADVTRILAEKGLNHVRNA